MRVTVEDNATRTSYHSDADMALIPKNFIFEGMALPVQIYIRLTHNTYLTIGKRGEKAQFENFKAFKNDNFQIYVKAEDRAYLTGFIEDLSRRTMDNSKISLNRKSQFVTGLLSEAFDELENSKFAKLERIQSVGNLVLKLCDQTTELSDVWEMLEAQKPDDTKHGLMTAMVSIMLAEEANLLSGLNQDKLVAGALLHDVGMRFVPDEVRNKSRTKWTPEDKQIYQQHPIHGAEILRFVEGMSVEVLLIISEHHELSNGTGYPKGIREVRINPLAKIVGLADQFCDLISNTEGKNYSAEEALVYIETVMGMPYNKGLFSSLKNLVNVRNLTGKIPKSS